MMAHLRIFVLISAFCLAYTAAEQLRCKVGEGLCKQLNWGYTGGINGDVVCCPTVSGQGFVMNMGLTAPDNCKCTVGTEEEYPNHASGLRAGSFVLHVLWVTLTWCVFRAARLF
ncbi:uncharacterized protein [Littorina saxatilis]|uniref:uncharacterized protein isoform X2 n=1 Tax=Littorina saxatilis TaxID=31220 RepID=UPI0038B464C0